MKETSTKSPKGKENRDRRGKPWGVIISVLLVLMGAIYLVAYAPILFKNPQITLSPPFMAYTETLQFEDLPFKNLDTQEVVTITDFQGDKPILVNFWASWCAPCIKELPSLEGLHNRGEVEVVTLSLDRFINERQVRDFVQNKAGVSDLPIYWDHNKQVGRSFNPQGLPVTYLLTPSGKIIGHFKGAYDWTEFDYSSNR